MVNDKEVVERLKKIMIENISPKINFEESEKFNLLDDVGFNSVMMVELIIAIESEFNIEFEDDFLDYETFANFDKLKNLIIKYLK